MATAAAYRAFRRTYTIGYDTTETQRNAVQTARYSHLWSLYDNAIFDDAAAWAQYKGYYGLYRLIRPIYNPVRRLVDFYAGIVYPGVLTIDPNQVPDGGLMAIPFADGTDAALLDAIAQSWQWSNWQVNSTVFVTYGAALGDVAVEVVDDLDRGVVYANVLWPWMVEDLGLDSTGNVTEYAIEYDYFGDDNRRYTYRKEVDGDRIATLRDGRPYSYYENSPAEYENPYGFAPLIWAKHKDIGTINGRPAVRNIVTLDELNSLASHMADHAHKIMDAPVVLSAESVRMPSADKAAATSAGDRTAEKVNFVQTEPGGAVSTIDMPEGEIVSKLQLLYDEIERTHPELTLYEKLREQSNVTGPGAEAMSGDVTHAVLNARASYDTQSVKLFQMLVAIGGYRANTGSWGPALNNQQRKFLPFDLESYKAGDLDLQIMPRPVIPMTPLDTIEYERRKLALETDRANQALGDQTLPQQVADRLRAAVPTPAAEPTLA